MSPKHFFFTEAQQGTSNLTSRTGGEAITVTPNFPSDPESQEIFLGISMDYSSADKGEAWTAVDADKLLDAIDKAVGKREAEADWRDGDRVEVDWPEGRIIVGRETVGRHVGRWAFPGGLHYGDDAVATLNPKAVGKREEPKFYVAPIDTPMPADGETLEDAGFKPLGWLSGDGVTLGEPKSAKPYRPIDRDRLLRHIEDLEATLTRRNERHGRDQERIRELEAEVFTLREIKDSYEEPKTAREHLKLAWEAAIVPKDGTIHAGEEYMLQGISGRVEGPLRAPKDRPHWFFAGTERRLLEPRPEPSEEDSYRKELEGKGLAEWEIELLVGSAV